MNNFELAVKDMLRNEASIDYLKYPTCTCIRINPLTPKSNQFINSPYNFNTLSSRQTMTFCFDKMMWYLYGALSKLML